jgi:hypothetical protein
VWWRYLSDEDIRDSGVSEKSYRTANAIQEEMEIFERQRKEPSATEAGRAAGRPYDLWRLVPAGLERFMAQLDAGDEQEPTPREEAEREKRREKEQQAKAEAQAREARHREEMARLVQIKYERDKAQQEAQERRRALEQAQQVMAEHQRRSPQIMACRSCGVKLDPVHLLCDECRERARAAQHLPANGNAHDFVVDVTALETIPRLCSPGRELVVNVTNNPPDVQPSERGTPAPPGERDTLETLSGPPCHGCKRTVYRIRPQAAGGGRVCATCHPVPPARGRQAEQQGCRP